MNRDEALDSMALSVFRANDKKAYVEIDRYQSGTREIVHISKELEGTDFESFFSGAAFVIPFKVSAQSGQEYHLKLGFALCTEAEALVGDRVHTLIYTVNSKDDPDGSGIWTTEEMTQRNPDSDGDVIIDEYDNNGTVEDIDGNVYQTRRYGTQVWMTENLRTTRYSNGLPIPTLPDEVWLGVEILPVETNNKAYCWYDLDIGNKDLGALYTWRAAMNDAPFTNSNPSHVRGACPNGWHMPSDAEWTQLVEYLKPKWNYDSPLSIGMARDLGWTAKYGYGNDHFEFGAIPVGQYWVSGRDFIYKGLAAMWWTTSEWMTEWYDSQPVVRGLGSDFHIEVQEIEASYNDAISIRCVKD